MDCWPLSCVEGVGCSLRGSDSIWISTPDALTINTLHSFSVITTHLFSPELTQEIATNNRLTEALLTNDELAALFRCNVHH